MTEAVVELPEVASDAALIVAVRRGDTAAFGVLYERHLGAARRVAVSLAANSTEREDLVAEAFARVLRILRAGQGPTEGFRPYLLTTMRNAVISWARTPSSSPVAEIPEARLAVRREDPMSTRVHATVAADAFASLPERWRTVLWHTEVEGESPAQIAPLLGLTPNGVAALAYRAREGLRQAYLQQHLPHIDRRDCRTITGQLAGWVRHGFATAKMERITTHLDQCADCREVATGLRQINNQLPAVVAPLILGAPLALAYLPASASLSASPAILAAASTGSWLTTAKTLVASAAIVTTTAVGTASDQVPTRDDPGIAISAPHAQPPTEQPSTGGPHLTARPTPDTSHPVAATFPAGTGTDPGTPPTETKADKQEKHATKAEAKAAKKADRKSEKKAAKEAEKANKKEKSTEPGKKGK